jgi:hypothetical protein
MSTAEGGKFLGILDLYLTFFKIFIAPSQNASYPPLAEKIFEIQGFIDSESCLTCFGISQKRPPTCFKPCLWDAETS